MILRNYIPPLPQFDSLVRKNADKYASALTTVGAFSSLDSSDSELRVPQNEVNVLRHDLLTVLSYLVRCLSLSIPAEERVLSTVMYKSGRVQAVLSAIHTVLIHLPTGVVRFRAFTDLVW